MESGYHVPIMLPEVLELIKPERGGVYIDGTLGGGGHSEGILARLPEGGRLYGIDRDRDAIEAATARLSRYPAFTAIHGNFFDMRPLLSGYGVDGADGILLDLGVSSHQLDDGSRGFSYTADARLDMRMDRSQSLSAFEVVNGYPTKRLYEIIRDYGEERFASRIANAIDKARRASVIETTGELTQIIKGAIPAAARREGPHPAKRTFQAIRIEVNGELAGLEKAVTDAAGFLKPGGVIAVITFHSLEDRIVKNVFRTLDDPCICPPSAPVCVCGRKKEHEILTNRPITADENELASNPRARSAKLRAARRLTI
ncbi:MAG: 16S rRNA (cytosine(1402)-N(4))-methyltransferase RsmH [Clostridia bacterium]|nr:16S rRNA (cytosine(1402)-N(4))-methyltransferase RsmH [Clostridia bacterium]